MSEEKNIMQEESQPVESKKATRAERRAMKQQMMAENEKPHRIRDFMSKTYKGENITMILLSVFAITLGVLIVVQRLTIDESYFIIGYAKGKLFAWILIALAVIALAFYLVPFYRPSFSEIKHLKPLSKAEFLMNVARTIVFILVLALFFFVCDLGLNPLMELIKK